MTQTNRLAKLVKATAKFPKGIRTTLWSKAFGRVVPMVGTANIKYVEVTHTQVIVEIKNHRAMQNHIGQVHAVAMALIAETATGFVVAMNVPDSSIVLIKSIKIDYKRPSKGNMKAVASLSEAQIQQMQQSEQGETFVPVIITDESSKEPIYAEMLWAWVSKDRLKTQSN